MNEPVKFPIYIVMRNGHIMPPGLLLHEANAVEVAKREEGEVITLYSAPDDGKGQPVCKFEPETTAGYVCHRCGKWSATP